MKLELNGGRLSGPEQPLRCGQLAPDRGCRSLKPNLPVHSRASFGQKPETCTLIQPTTDSRACLGSLLLAAPPSRSPPPGACFYSVQRVHS